MWITTPLLAGAIGATSCESSSDSPTILETLELEHIEVARTSDEPLCSGSPVAWDEHVAALTELFRLPETEALHLEVGDPSIAAHCPGSADEERFSSCVQGSGREAVAYSIPASAPHELVHLVRAANGLVAPPLFEEGVAFMMGQGIDTSLAISFAPNASSRMPSELARMGWDEVEELHYTVGSHFLAFLVDLHGLDAVVAFLGGDVSRGGDVDDAFEEAFDMTLEQADELWLGWSLAQSWGRPCDPSRELSFSGGPITLEGELDCASTTTIGGQGGMESRRSCLRFTEDTPVSVSVTGDEGVVARLVFTACGQEKLLPTLVDAEVAAGETVEFETLGCDGAVWVRTDDLERRSYVVTIERG